MSPEELRRRADRLNEIRRALLDLLFEATAAVEDTPQEGVPWLQQIRAQIDDDHGHELRAEQTILSSVAALLALADGDDGRPSGWP